MKVYIAAPYPEIVKAKSLLQLVEAAGHSCTSRWIRGEFEAFTAENAAKDLDDVMTADVLIAYNPPTYENLGTGGRHVELGYALARGKLIVLLGAQSNIFHTLPQVIPVKDDSQLIGVLRGLAVEA